MSAPPPAGPSAPAPGARHGRPPRTFARSWLPWIPLAVVLAVALAIGVGGSRGPATTQERVTAIAESIRCPTCRGESVAESQAELSKAIRIDIAQRVETGQTDEEIRDAYVSRYGETILLTPPASGVAGLVWVLPVVVLVAGLAAVAAAFRRWQREPVVHATDADRALVADALAAGHEAAGADERGRS